MHDGHLEIVESTAEPVFLAEPDFPVEHVVVADRNIRGGDRYPSPH
jgi:hypothetical protein